MRSIARTVLCTLALLTTQTLVGGASPPPASRAGSVHDRESGIRYRRIPAGTFAMGCLSGDPDCDEDEMPNHRVTLSAFLLAETETTNEQYRRCVTAGACDVPGERFWYEDPVQTPSLRSQVLPSRRDHPVVFVGWEDAVAYCHWAGGRLPTEAEWEYAARGGLDSARFPAGWTLTRDQANYGQDHCCGGMAAGQDRWELTAPVRSFPANGYALFDMTGNAWEWIADWYGRYPAAPATDPRGPTSGTQRVLRGGSWYLSPAFLRFSDRGASRPSTRALDYGFRCAHDADPEPDSGRR